jgi:large repetitive protein
VDCKSVLALARFARRLTAPRGTLALALALLACGVTIPASAGADLDPTNPSASFTFTPQSPNTGSTVTLRSTSTPGLLGAEIVAEEWDLNNDGVFGDDTGTQVKTSFATPGDHTVGLKVTDANGASDVATGVVTVVTQSPSASFSVTPQSPTTLETVTFTSTSTDPDGSIASYAWDLDNDGNFNDGTDSQAQRSFLFAGTYTVRLLVTDNDGASAVATEDVAVGNQPPVASFEHSPASPSTGEQVTLTSTSIDPDGSITDYTWDLNGDGDFGDATGSTAQVIFDSPGGHTVRLRVTDGDGATSTAEEVITAANRPPTASFTSSPPDPKTGEQVTFTSTSTDPDDGIASYAWDLDADNQFDDGTGPTAHKSFPAAGTYTVNLKVTDASGVTDTVSGTVDVANRDPSASFTSSPSAPKTGDPVTFTSTSTDSDGTIASLGWDLDNDGQFNDGAGQQAQKTFSVPGTYTIRLLVVDNDGGFAVATGSVQIGNRPPTAGFGFSPTSPKTLEPVTFTSTSTDPDGSIDSYAWDLDNDGQYDDASGPSAERSFPVAGNYTVKLRVTDSNGATDTATKVVSALNQAPTASFETSPAEPTTDGPVTFTSKSSDPEGLPLTTTWDLDDDGSFETSGASVQHQYTAPGSYNFKVRVVDASGASDSASGTVTIPNRPPTASVDHTPKSPQTRVPIVFTATAGDPEHRVKSLAWDSDNDGQFDDGTGTTVTKAFNRPGAYTVRFRIEDLDGSSAVAEDVVAVNNQPPVASFVVLPESPTTGVPATLVSTSLDPDTPLEKWQWDLDGDGSYDDAEGPQIQFTFPAAGSYSVGLRVFDSEEVADFVLQTVVVQPPPPPVTAAPQLAPSYQLLSPFPIVRLAGRIDKAGTRLRLFSIEAPPGARVVVTCRGRGCPFRHSARSAAAPKDGKAHASASLRIRKLEKRLLKRGVKITISITKGGTIGKYVQFKFRRLRPPARVDRCLMPNAPSKPVECPS